jgi:tetratricopeptide (TPR) repeat protein
VWAERYREARSVYGALLQEQPDDYALRLELARALYWDNRPVGAYLTLCGVPATVAESEEGTQLRLLLDSLLLASLPPSSPPLERARAALAAGHLSRAEQLYRRVLFSQPTDPAVWLEWVDFLQYHAEDQAAALQALQQLARLRELTPDEQYRLAQLHMWAGNEAEAAAVLEQLLDSQPQRAEAWALLGDLYQWRGSPFAAKRAYERSLALSPGNPVATAGLDSLQQRTYRVIAAREIPSAGARLFYFRDSDEYGRLDLIAEAGYLRRATIVVVRAGYRHLEGGELDGQVGTDRGPFAEVELAHWWRLGTVRTSLTAGIERLEAFGNQPSLEARLSIPNASGTGFTALYRHGPAFPQTVTFQSIQASLLTDYLEAAAFRRIAARWTLAVNGTVGSLHTSGNGNLRATVGAAAVHEFSRVLSAGLTTQYLTLAGPAPRLDGRRLYWDPQLFWATGIRIQLNTVPESAWRLYARVTPGVALDNERDSPGTEWVPQLASEAGIRFENRRFILAGDLAYLRGREGGYNSFGANLLFAVKY